MASKSVLSRLLHRISLAPENAERHQALGKWYLKQRNLERAKIALERSLELGPRDAFTHLYLGSCHYAARDFLRSLEYFKAASVMLPTESVAFICVGDAHWGLGEIERARESYQQALKLDTDREWTLRRMQRLEAEVLGESPAKPLPPTT